MDKPRKRAPGGGRKPAALQRPIDRNRSFYLYADQVERVTPAEVRRYVDAALAARDFVNEVQNLKNDNRPDGE